MSRRRKTPRHIALRKVTLRIVCSHGERGKDVIAHLRVNPRDLADDTIGGSTWTNGEGHFANHQPDPSWTVHVDYDSSVVLWSDRIDDPQPNTERSPSGRTNIRLSCPTCPADVVLKPKTADAILREMLRRAVTEMELRDIARTIGANSPVVHEGR